MKILSFILFTFLSLYSFQVEIERPNQYTNQDVSGWVMSEKLDGIRGYWNGKEFLSKNGNKIYAPASFTKNFPSFELDGELWTKRNDFSNIQSIVLDKTPSKYWKEISYNIFEAPNAKGNFLERVNKAKNWFKNNPNSQVHIIEQIVCKNKKHLYDYLKKIVLLKGEGVIVKDPKQEYIKTRTNKALKVTMFYDTEGRVEKINYGKNNTMRSLLIKLENNVTFNLGGGFSKDERANPPSVGDIVTFKYYGLTKNKKPRFASFLRIRKEE